MQIMELMTGQSLNWADYAIVIIIAISAIVSFARGFMREALSLVLWVLAFGIAFTLSSHLAPVLTFIKTPSLRVIAAFALLFLAVLLVGSVITYLFAKIIQHTGLTGVDRVLGILFGAARGVLLISVLILLASFTVIKKDPWWANSQFLPYFYPIASWLREFLPEQVQNLSIGVLQTT